MTRARVHFLFLNAGHFLDHLFLLVFASAAALTLARDWGMSYAELIPYATPGFVAFAVCAIPAGWIADKWSRQGMMAIFFLGIGLSAMLAAQADTPLQIAFGLFAIGVFAAIYHPVGLALVVQDRDRTGVPLAINGIFGNLGVACAALITGFLIDWTGWRAAFVLPGAISVLIGIAYSLFVIRARKLDTATVTVTAPATAPATAAAPSATGAPAVERRVLVRLFAIVFFTTALGGLIFQSTTFSLPKVFDERLGDIAGSASLIGGYAFIVFAVAAFAQLAVGYLVDRHSLRQVFAVVAGLQAVFFAAMVQLTGMAALVVSMAFMLAVFGQIPINDVLVGRATKSAWRSRVFALRYVVTFSTAAAAVPLIAWIHTRGGFSTLFLVLSAAAAAIFVAVLLLPHSRHTMGADRTETTT